MLFKYFVTTTRKVINTVTENEEINKSATYLDRSVTYLGRCLDFFVLRH